MSEQQTAFPVDCSPVEVQPDSDRASVSLAPALDKSASSSKLLEALKWIFSFPAMLGVALIGRVFYQGRGFSIDPDMWWHIKVGQDIVHNHHWPTSDPYSFTVHGTPWMAYEWLGDVALGFVGRFGLQALDALLI